jgi:AbiJ-like protein
MERRFSERMGAAPPRMIQVDSMDEPLRHSIWNLVAGFIDAAAVASGRGAAYWVSTVQEIAREFLRVPVERVPSNSSFKSRQWLFKQYEALEWYRVYDLLEFVVDKPAPQKAANRILERELSAFRFVNGQLTRLTGAVEVRAIENASHAATAAGLDGVREHLDEAVRQLGRRPEPNYRNAIKEAISAVESAVSGMAGLTKPDLDGAIRLLREKGLVHSAMGAAFVKLFAYTSDAGGIRHALLEEDTPADFDEAKFMVVACSAFVNFLIAKADAAGLLKK